MLKSKICDKLRLFDCCDLLRCFRTAQIGEQCTGGYQRQLFFLRRRLPNILQRKNRQITILISQCFHAMCMEKRADFFGGCCLFYRKRPICICLLCRLHISKIREDPGFLSAHRNISVLKRERCEKKLMCRVM